MPKLLSRCPQIVDRPYPLWGESHFLTVGHRREPLHFLWRPAVATAQGGVLLVHGMNEYIGRYHHVAEHFCARFHVLGVDLHAHGLTNPVLRQADREIRAGAGRFDASAAFLAQAPLGNLDLMREDFLQGLAFLRKRVTGPVFVLAHSLGGLVAASSLLDGTAGVDGVILVGPAFAVSRLPLPGGRVANPLLRLSFRLSEDCIVGNKRPACLLARSLEGILQGLSLPGVRWLFSPCRPSWVASYLTDREQERQRLEADGYIVRRVLLSYVKGIEKEIVRFRRQMKAFRLPYFLVYAEADPITAAWGNRDFVRQTLGNHSMNRVQVLQVPYHEQLFMKPPTPQKLLRTMDEWVSGVMASK